MLQGRKNLLFSIIALSAFALAVAGFFLSWGTSYMGNSNNPFDPSPVRHSVTLAHTGKNASIYGYAQLACGILGLLAAAIGLAGMKGLVKTGVLSAASIGLLFHVILRIDPRVTLFGSIGYALSHGDFSLGYSMGPGVGIIGFLSALVVGTMMQTGHAYTYTRSSSGEVSQGEAADAPSASLTCAICKVGITDFHYEFEHIVLASSVGLQCGSCGTAWCRTHEDGNYSEPSPGKLQCKKCGGDCAMLQGGPASLSMVSKAKREGRYVQFIKPPKETTRATEAPMDRSSRLGA